jgi:hypothetical protein
MAAEHHEGRGRNNFEGTTYFFNSMAEMTMRWASLVPS